MGCSRTLNLDPSLRTPAAFGRDGILASVGGCLNVLMAPAIVLKPKRYTGWGDGTPDIISKDLTFDPRP